MTSGRLADNTIIVTGAGSGISANSARLFARNGASVVVVDLNLEAATGVAREIKAEGG